MLILNITCNTLKKCALGHIVHILRDFKTKIRDSQTKKTTGGMAPVVTPSLAPVYNVSDKKESSGLLAIIHSNMYIV